MGSLLKPHRNIGVNYVNKIIGHCYVKEALAFYGRVANQIEYPLLVWEQVGIPGSIGSTFYFDAWLHIINGNMEVGERLIKDSENVCDAMINLIKNNPGTVLPFYDEHCIELNLALLLMYFSEKKDDAEDWLNEIRQRIYYSYKLSGFFPLFRMDEEKLAELVNGNAKAEITSSFFMLCLIEWSIMCKDYNLYTELKKMIDEHFKSHNLQMWYPEKDSDSLLYSENATTETGSTQHSIRIPGNYRELEMVMAEETRLFESEKGMSAIENQFMALPWITSRHFRTYVFPSYWRSFLATQFCFNRNNEEKRLDWEPSYLSLHSVCITVCNSKRLRRFLSKAFLIN